MWRNSKAKVGSLVGAREETTFEEDGGSSSGAQADEGCVEGEEKGLRVYAEGRELGRVM